MVSSSSLSILLNPTSSLHTHASSYSSSPTTYGRLVSPFKALLEKPKPPNSVSLRSSQKSCVKFVAFSSNINTQVTEDGSSPEQLLHKTSKFERFKEGSDGGSWDLQTSIVSYKSRFPTSRLQVDLVSTVHIADKEYYKTLQKELESYDCVLFEMVISREGLVKTGKHFTLKRLEEGSFVEGFTMIGFIQCQVAGILGLQIDCLDYKADNWFHADLDYETFEQLQLERGEDLFTLVGDVTLKEDMAEDQVSGYQEIEALSRLDFGAAMKIFVAKGLVAEFPGPAPDVEANSVIIGERNRAACEALTRAIDEGHKRIAILYGVDHMPDLERRLQEGFNLSPTGVRWITAWAIRCRALDTLAFLSALAIAILILLLLRLLGSAVMHIASESADACLIPPSSRILSWRTFFAFFLSEDMFRRMDFRPVLEVVDNTLLDPKAKARQGKCMLCVDITSEEMIDWKRKGREIH
ncbi:hypothetical protein Tsubulata_121923 [Turnera subulata]|uniref:Uncharacterized protein n=1 Tax=Turnera subulata TaxID=218843 RepID=A0A9Q0F1Q0_9ROSI|nr:hypothetical protein Tsubulata_121923 [Turnera subulata]